MQEQILKFRDVLGEYAPSEARDDLLRALDTFQYSTNPSVIDSELLADLQDTKRRFDSAFSTFTLDLQNTRVESILNDPRHKLTLEEAFGRDFKKALESLKYHRRFVPQNAQTGGLHQTHSAVVLAALRYPVASLVSLGIGSSSSAVALNLSNGRRKLVRYWLTQRAEKEGLSIENISLQVFSPLGSKGKSKSNAFELSLHGDPVTPRDANLRRFTPLRLFDASNPELSHQLNIVLLDYKHNSNLRQGLLSLDTLGSTKYEHDAELKEQGLIFPDWRLGPGNPSVIVSDGTIRNQYLFDAAGFQQLVSTYENSTSDLSELVNVPPSDIAQPIERLRDLLPTSG